MENITSIVSNNPFYLAQLSIAPAPVKFDTGGVVPKVNNTGAYCLIGVIILAGGFIAYKIWTYETKNYCM